MLWFTFEFLSLIKFFQYSWVLFIPAIGCDLLSNFYLWLSSFNIGIWNTKPFGVVIYFRISIFD